MLPCRNPRYERSNVSTLSPVLRTHGVGSHGTESRQQKRSKTASFGPAIAGNIRAPGLVSGAIPSARLFSFNPQLDKEHGRRSRDHTRGPVIMARLIPDAFINVSPRPGSENGELHITSNVGLLIRVERERAVAAFAQAIDPTYTSKFCAHHIY
jgi:hypothetical protein